MNEDFLMTISPFVRVARIMQTKNLSGKWIDFDHCVTGIVNGEADFIMQGTKYHMVKGDIIIIPPLCRHEIISSSETPLIQYIFHFDFAYYKSRSSVSETMFDEKNHPNDIVPETEKVMNHTPLVVHLNSQELLEFQNNFLQLLIEYKDKSPLYHLSMKALCIKILVICLRNQNKTYISASKSSPKVRTNVQRAIEYIHRNYDNPELNNDQIAASIGVSSKYLSHIFQDETGLSIHKYLNQIRIEAAQHLAALGTMNVTEIAHSVGYRSIYTFSAIFKKTTGLTPSEFLQTKFTHTEGIYLKSDAMNRPKRFK